VSLTSTATRTNTAEGIRILQDMMLRSNVFPIRGNHEFTAAVCLPWLMEEVTDQSLDALDEMQIAALSEWIVNGGGPTLRALKALSREEREKLLKYIREMDVYAEVEVGGQSYLLVHAGLGRFVPGRTLIFGHTPTRLLWEEAGEVARDEIFKRGDDGV